MSNTYSRDLIGYGADSPDPKWPGGARIAVQFVLNYEEGAENCILHGDDASESFLSEIIGASPWKNERHMSMESIYEYGSRVGIWRILNLFQEEQLPLTIFGVAMALDRNPKVAEAALKSNFEICSHGYRWIDYRNVPENIEREHMEKAIEIIKNLTGQRPLGWYTGRTSANTRRLVVEEGGFLYDADDYNDDLPYWSYLNSQPHLVIPYTLDNNDMRFATPQGFNCGDQFFTYLKDSFDSLYAEGEKRPKMMSIGLHCRLIGRPGRIKTLKKFISYAKSFKDVWFCRRIDIANHWIKTYPPANNKLN